MVPAMCSRPLSTARATNRSRTHFVNLLSPRVMQRLTDEPKMTPERANEMAFRWLSQHAQHAYFCKKVRDRITPQESRSGLCKDYGGRYATEEELAKIDCSCGLDDVHDALCQASSAPLPRCTACQGDGVVRRSFGWVPCDACDGKGH